MIFLTIGTQFNFDRLIRIVDKWAKENPSLEIFAQIGHSEYQPINFGYKDFLSPEEFDNKFAEADLIISHAGTGTIMKALLMEKPIVVFPRDAKAGEHRNDHQLATVKSFKKMFNLEIACTEEQLMSKMDRSRNIKPGKKIKNWADKELINRINQFISR